MEDFKLILDFKAYTFPQMVLLNPPKMAHFCLEICFLSFFLFRFVYLRVLGKNWETFINA